MKIIIVSVFMAFLALPVFSQSANTQRFNQLSTSMGSTISSSTSKLESFDEMLTDNGNMKFYATYRDRYGHLSKALQESEARLNRMFQSNERTANIKKERDNYASLLEKLETLKSEYDQRMGNSR